MKCKELFAKIAELNADYLDIWEDVCNIESPTSFKEGVDAVGRYFAHMATERGWKVEYMKQRVSGDVVCITLNPESTARPITFSGHMDTVHPVGSFGTPTVHRDEKSIYGPGVTDCKGGLVAAFLAMDALDKCGFRSRPIQLLLQSDEEVGSRFSDKTTIGYICEKAKDAVAFLNVEGHPHGKACLKRKGIVSFSFKVKGVEAHASNCAVIGANAILEAAHKIIELEKIKDDAGVTCCCSIINGGTVLNTVPGECEFKANVRFATNEQYEWMCRRAQEIADTVYVPGCSCELSRIGWRYAMELVDRNEELLDKINAIYSQNGLPELEAHMSKGGSDAADATVYGIPCVDSLGVEGENIHSPNESAYLSSLAESACRLAAVAYCI